MSKKNNPNNNERVINVEGSMSFGQLKNGLHTADFECYEKVEVTPFTANCKVQKMRDGNVYITELPKRARNKPIFREDNCSLSLGRDGRFYFVFSLDEALIDVLPTELVDQAGAIAQKVIEMYG